jgi:hypothetical protein
MTRILAVHGIANQYSGENQIRSDWLPALQDGLSRAGKRLEDETMFSCAFYGDLFRPSGQKLHDQFQDSSDINDEWEKMLLACWWKEAARIDSGVPRPDGQSKSWGVSIVQSALDALSHSKFFSGLAEAALIADLKQVRIYLKDPQLRSEVRKRVIVSLGSDTRVLIGHSLGSVVGYEALCIAPNHSVRTFITIGSPLGIRNLIFEQLEPPPVDGVGKWPTGVRQWINVADRGDIVALRKQLASSFGPGVTDRLVDNGAKAHDAGRYLCSKEVGDAVATEI